MCKALTALVCLCLVGSSNGVSRVISAGAESIVKTSDPEGDVPSLSHPKIQPFNRTHLLVDEKGEYAIDETEPNKRSRRTDEICHNHGTYDGRFCDCDGPWVGAACNIPCYGNGKLLTNGSCDCFAGYSTSVTDCYYFKCPHLSTPVPYNTYKIGTTEGPCGLGEDEHYPMWNTHVFNVNTSQYYSKSDVVGVVRNPVSKDSRDDSLLRIDSDKIFFLEDSFRYMTINTRDSLLKLAETMYNVGCSPSSSFNKVNFADCTPTAPNNTHNLVIAVIDGWRDDISELEIEADIGLLTAEGRQLTLVPVSRDYLSGSVPSNQMACLTAYLNSNGKMLNDESCKGVVLYGDHPIRWFADEVMLAGFSYLRHDRPNNDVAINTGDSITVAEVSTGCGGKVDMVFLLDGSASVKETGWKNQLEFVEEMVARFDTGDASKTRIGVATFAGPRTAHFATDPDHVTVTPFDPPQACKRDEDCYDIDPMDLMYQSNGKVSLHIERCNADFLCEEVIPVDCANGEFYGHMKTAGGDVPVCLCQSGLACDGLSYVGPELCTAGSANCDTGCRGGSHEEEVDGCSDTAADTCTKRSFYDFDCQSCECQDAVGDWHWDLSKSAWTEVSMNATVTTLLEELKAGKTAGTCPSPVSDVAGFATKKPLCFPNGASHLKMGLLHVLDNMLVLSKGGMRPLSEGVPRVLVTLTDGKANPNFGADELAAATKSYGVRLFAIGMSQNEYGETNYETQLRHLASAPVNRHMFEVDGTSDLDMVVNQLSQEMCETVTLVPPDITITAPIDSGGTEFFQWECARNSKKVTVVLDASTPNVHVAVSNHPNPSLYAKRDSQVAIDTRPVKHKVISYNNTIAGTARTVYAAVSYTKAAGGDDSVDYSITLYLNDVFEDLTDSVWPQEPLASGGEVYAPQMSTLAGDGPFEYKLGDVGNELNYFEMKTASTGVVTLTSLGASALTSDPTFSTTLEVYVNGTGECLALGIQLVNVSRNPDIDITTTAVTTATTSPATSLDTTSMTDTSTVATTPTVTDGGDEIILIVDVENVREFVGDCGLNDAAECAWPRLTDDVPAVVGNEVSVVTVEGADTFIIDEETSSPGAVATFGLQAPTRRHSREVASVASVASDTGEITVVITNPQNLNSTWAATNVLVFNAMNGAVIVKTVKIDIPALVESNMSPYFVNALAKVSVYSGEATLVVANPDDLDWKCGCVGPCPGMTVKRESSTECKIEVKNKNLDGFQTIDVELTIDKESVWPAASVALEIFTEDPCDGKTDGVSTCTSLAAVPYADSCENTQGLRSVCDLFCCKHYRDNDLQDPKFTPTVSPTSSPTSSPTEEVVIIDAGTSTGENNTKGSLVGGIVGALVVLIIIGILLVWLFVFRKPAADAKAQRSDGTMINSTYGMMVGSPQDTYDTIDDGVGMMQNPAFTGLTDAIDNPMYGMQDDGGGMYATNGPPPPVPAENDRNHGQTIQNSLYQAANTPQTNDRATIQNTLYQAAPGITPKDMPGPMANPMYGMGMDEPNYNVVDQSSGVLYSVALDEESC